MTSQQIAYIEGLPPLRQVVDQAGLRAEKSLGQNFIFDLNITHKIATAAKISPNSTILEIGPGPGGLTRALLHAAVQNQAHLTVIEKDYRALPHLESLAAALPDHLKVIEGDALEIDLAQIGQMPRCIVANLPYNIATVLMIDWMKKRLSFERITVLVQKEVAARLVAKAGDSAYGRLAILTQWLMTPQILFDLPPTVFNPAPKVMSSLVQLTPKQEVYREKEVPIAAVEHLTNLAFQQRRKMLRASLRSLRPNMDEILESVGILPTQRPEELPFEKFVDLAAKLK